MIQDRRVIENTKQILCFEIILISLWCFIFLWKILPSFQIKDEYRSFLPFVYTIGLSVVAILLYNIITKIKESNDLPDVPRDYPTCLVTINKENEGDLPGAIGKFSLGCRRNQYDMIHTSMITNQNQIYNIIYAIFTLVLLIVAVPRTKKIISSGDMAVKTLVLLSITICLFSLLQILFVDQYWQSIVYMVFSKSMYQINGLVVALLVTYIGYTVVVK